MVPGADVPIRLITPIKSDFRYRQYKEIKIPASNAVIFFARDCSGSMDDYKCDIVSDMAWWLDCWIKKFYDKVDRCYYVHDTQATEVSEDDFYSYRFGGGTMCSSAFEAVAEQFENRYRPEKYNIYLFYFTDGDNWGDDNNKFVKIIKEKMGAEVVNLVGITQICAYGYGGTVKSVIDTNVKDGTLSSENIQTASIGSSGVTSMSEEDRNMQIIAAIKQLLGKVSAENSDG